MNAVAQLPVSYIPLARLGVVATSLTYVFVARASVANGSWMDRFGIGSFGTRAICLYALWTMAAGLLLVLPLGRKGVSSTALGLGSLPSLLGVGLALISLGIGVLWWPVAEPFARTLGIRAVHATHQPIMWRRPRGKEADWLAFCTVLAVPPLEEFIFRRYVYSALRQTVRTPSAVVDNSAIVASIHFAHDAKGDRMGPLASVVFASFTRCRSSSILRSSRTRWFGVVDRLRNS